MPAITTESDQRFNGTLLTWDPQALAASGVVYAGRAQLVELYGYSDAAAIRYIQLFDATAVPADGAAPTFAPIKVAIGGSFSLKLDLPGLSFGNGIAWASSSSSATKTVTVAADVWLNVRYLKVN